MFMLYHTRSTIPPAVAAKNFARISMLILMKNRDIMAKLEGPADPHLLKSDLVHLYDSAFLNDFLQYSPRQHIVRAPLLLKDNELTLLTNYAHIEGSKNTEPKDLNAKQLLYPKSEIEDALGLLRTAVTLLNNEQKCTAFFDEHSFGDTLTKMTPGLFCVLSIRAGTTIGAHSQDIPFDTSSYVGLYNIAFNKSISSKEFTTWEKRFYHLLGLIRVDDPKPAPSDRLKQ